MVETANEEQPISVCDVMKSNTSTMIKKLESQIPSYIQSYSDTYSEYLHLLDDLFGTCYISEKQFFDKLNIDPKILRSFDEYSKKMTEVFIESLDTSTAYMRSYNEMRISIMKNYDMYLHSMIDSYAKMLACFNSTYDK